MFAFLQTTPFRVLLMFAIWGVMKQVIVMAQNVRALLMFAFFDPTAKSANIYSARTFVDLQYMACVSGQDVLHLKRNNRVVAKFPQPNSMTFPGLFHDEMEKLHS